MGMTDTGSSISNASPSRRTPASGLPIRWGPSVRCLWALVVAFALILYGVASVAEVPAGRLLTRVEICADGASQTIWLAPDGRPVEAGQPCCKCLKCQAHASAAPADITATHRPFSRERKMARLEPVGLPVRDRTGSPLPRGPPADAGPVDPTRQAVGILSKHRNPRRGLEFGQVQGSAILRKLRSSREDGPR